MNSFDNAPAYRCWKEKQEEQAADYKAEREADYQAHLDEKAADYIAEKS